MPHLEEPDRFLDLVEAFLAKADSLLEAGP